MRVRTCVFGRVFERFSVNMSYGVGSLSVKDVIFCNVRSLSPASALSPCMDVTVLLWCDPREGEGEEEKEDDERVEEPPILVSPPPPSNPSL